jgi:hypothetical protein
MGSEASPSSPDAEAGLTRRELVDHLDAAHRGPWRPASAPLDQRVDVRGGALEHGFDTPVGEVPDHAVDAAGARFACATVAEPHTLHAAGHEDAPANPRCLPGHT